MACLVAEVEQNWPFGMWRGRSVREPIWVPTADYPMQLSPGSYPRLPGAEIARGRSGRPLRPGLSHQGCQPIFRATSRAFSAPRSAYICVTSAAA